MYENSGIAVRNGPEQVYENLRRAQSDIGLGLNLQLLTERREGHRAVYAFRHSLTREAFSDELVGPDRQRAHRDIADAIAHVHRDSLAPVSGLLADHYAEAGEVALAVEYGLRAARTAVASYAHEEGARRYEEILRLIGRESADRLLWLLEAAEAVAESPDHGLAAAFATEARDTARERSDAVAEGRALAALSRLAW